MKDEVYAAVGFGATTKINTTATTALNGPSTQAAMIQAQKDIHTLVTSGKIKVTDNLHLLLGTVNANVFQQPTATPTQYHDFNSLNIFAIKLS